LLNAMPAEEIAKRYEQQLERARILPGGALIIHTVMKWLELDKIRVSLHGLREGVLLAYARYGDSWLEQVNDIASQEGKDSDEDKRAEEQKKDFVQFGQDALSKSAKKFVKWRDDILKNEDVEAVHKMRVASRHLRATLDAYESCCQPKIFKKLNKRIKTLADRLGTVRDTDVMLQGLHEQLSQMSSQDQAGVQWLIDRLETYHKPQEKVLEASLQKLDEKAFRQQVKTCISQGV
jgi:CHAD domain/Ppx/GppA phosphatase family